MGHTPSKGKRTHFRMSQKETLLQEIEELEWNCQAKECVEKCEQFLKLYPDCREVIPSYAHMLQFFDYVKATDMAKKLYDEQPEYFKNTYIYAYLLFDFDKRGKQDIQAIKKLCKSYTGEKNIYFYMAYAIAEKQLENYEENVSILIDAFKKFQGDKMLARVCHHIAATTASDEFMEESIRLQPNFDFNHLHKAMTYGVAQSEKALNSFQYILTINPYNNSAYFYIALHQIELDNHEAAKEAFDMYFSLKPTNASQIKQYLQWRVQQERSKEVSNRQKISIDYIKSAYQFEYESDQNIQIIQLYFQNLELFQTEQDNSAADQARDLLLFFVTKSIPGFLNIYAHLAINKISEILLTETSLKLKSLFALIAYHKFIKTEITFKSEFLMWDLFFD